MNYIPQVAKMLGVEVGERFKIIVNGMEKKGLFYFENGAIGSGFFEENHQDTINWILIALIFGEAKIKKLPWKPKMKEMYYSPWVDGGKLDYIYLSWNNDSVNLARYDAGLVCRTKEEAIDKAKKMLAAVKDDG